MFVERLRDKSSGLLQVFYREGILRSRHATGQSEMSLPE